MKTRIPNMSFCFPAIFLEIFTLSLEWCFYGHFLGRYACDFVWNFPEVLGIEKFEHRLPRIQFSISKVVPVRSDILAVLQWFEKKKKLTKIPPGVCSQLTYLCINFCGILVGWNMSVVWSFGPNGIMVHLDFDAYFGFSDTLRNANMTGGSIHSWIKRGWDAEPVGETYLPESTSLALMPAGDRWICFM